MPVTVKLSRRFYEKLGDDVANELVDVMNAADQGYRSEFRELFDLRFGQYDAKLDAFRAEFLGRLDGGLNSVRAELRAEMRATVAQSEKTIIRWMFGFWIGQLAVTLGMMIAMRQLLL